MFVYLAFCLQSNVVERHFHDLLQRYGETVAVDLTDKVRVSSLFYFPKNDKSDL